MENTGEQHVEIASIGFKLSLIVQRTFQKTQIIQIYFFKMRIYSLVDRHASFLYTSIFFSMTSYKLPFYSFPPLNLRSCSIANNGIVRVQCTIWMSRIFMIMANSTLSVISSGLTSNIQYLLNILSCSYLIIFLLKEIIN